MFATRSLISHENSLFYLSSYKVLTVAVCFISNKTVGAFHLGNEDGRKNNSFVVYVYC